MQSVNPKWLETGVVLVCERCSKERIPEETPDVAEEMGDFQLRDWLKRELKERGAWGPVRVVSSSCLDVCAKGKITVSLVPTNGERVVVIVDPIHDRDELLSKIVEM